MASGSFAISRFRWAMMASYCSSGLFRSFHSFRVTKKKPLYVFWAMLSRLMPGTAWKCSTPGVFFRISSIFLHVSVGALEGGGVGQGHVDEEISLVFLGKEPLGDPLAEKTGKKRYRREKTEAQGALTDEGAAHGDITLGGPAEKTVEGPEKGAERSPRLFPRLQEQGAEGGAEGQGVEGGDKDGDGDGHRKLLVEPARDARDEDRGDEDRREDQGNGHDRARDLVHGLDRRLLRARGPPRCDAPPPPRR